MLIVSFLNKLELMKCYYYFNFIIFFLFHLSNSEAAECNKFVQDQIEQRKAFVENLVAQGSVRIGETDFYIYKNMYVVDVSHPHR